MREERGQIAGDITFCDEVELWGNVGGNVTVTQGAKFYLRGAVYGNLVVEPGGRVHIFGQVKGDVTLQKKTKLVHSGVIGGDLINDGGRLYVDRTAKIGGKIKTKSGQTKLEGNQPPQPLG